MSLPKPIAAAGRRAAFLAYLGLTFFLSSQSRVPAADKVPDVLLHGPEFIVMTLLFVSAWNGRLLCPKGGRVLLAALVFGVGYGVLDELHQWFVPGRDASVKDAVVDAAATALTVLTLAGLARRGRERGRGRIAVEGGPGAPRGDKAGWVSDSCGDQEDRCVGDQEDRSVGDHEDRSLGFHSLSRRLEGQDAGEGGFDAGEGRSDADRGREIRDGAGGFRYGVGEGPASDPPRIELLTRTGCHLCDGARGALSEVLGSPGSAWKEVDVDSDPALVALYGLEVPVVLVDGIKRFKGRVDSQRLGRLLAGRGRLRGHPPEGLRTQHTIKRGRA